MTPSLLVLHAGHGIWPGQLHGLLDHGLLLLLVPGLVAFGLLAGRRRRSDERPRG